MGRVVVGVDESAGAAAALRWAVAEAEARGGSSTVVLAWGFLDQHHARVGEPFDPAYGEADAWAALDAIVAEVVVLARAATIDHKVVCDRPARALLEASEGADLLVVGRVASAGSAALLLGSVSQQCLHHATCPVAVVREGVQRAREGVGRIVVGIDEIARLAVLSTGHWRRAVCTRRPWRPSTLGRCPTPAVSCSPPGCTILSPSKAPPATSSTKPSSRPTPAACRHR